MFRKTAEQLLGGWEGGGLKSHPNPITGPAWQQPMDWGSLFNFSESGLGRGHSYYLLALRLLDYMEFAIEATTEYKLGGGHTLQPHSLGTGDK